jgi:hypothetical protein
MAAYSDSRVRKLRGGPEPPVRAFMGFCVIDRGETSASARAGSVGSTTNPAPVARTRSACAPEVGDEQIDDRSLSRAFFALLQRQLSY